MAFLPPRRVKLDFFDLSEELNCLLHPSKGGRKSSKGGGAEIRGVESSVARVLAENLISPRPRGSREAWFRHPRFLHPRSETSSLAPTAIAFTKRLASPPLPPPRSRQALTAREGADRVEGSAPLGLGPAGPGARELAREKPCCHFFCVEVERGARLRRAPSRSLAQRLALGRVIFPTTRGPTALLVSNGLLQGSWGRRRTRIGLSLSSVSCRFTITEIQAEPSATWPKMMTTTGQSTRA